MKLFAFTHDGRLYELIVSVWSGMESLRLDGREVSRLRSFWFTSRHWFELPMGEVAELCLHINGMRGRVHYTLRIAGRLVRDDEVGLPMPAATGQWWVGMTEPEEASVVAAGCWSRLRRFVGRSWFVKTVLAAVSFITAAWLMNLPMAVALMGLMVVHEQGHLWAMRHCGLGHGGMYLIPFVGGLAFSKRPGTPGQTAFIALMGPLAVLCLSLVLLGLYLLDGSRMLGLAATLGVVISLIDLVPVHPLDGGRLIAAMVLSDGRRLGVGSLLMLSGLGFGTALWLGSALLGIIALLGAFQLVSAWGSPPDPTAERLEARGRAWVLCGYLGTVTILLGLLLVMADLGVPGTAWLEG
jgi:Zn-dependent protease